MNTSTDKIISLESTWIEAWHVTRFRWQFLGTMACLAITLACFTSFLLWVEVREGVVLRDPILEMFQARDFTWLIFGLIYAAILIAIASMTPRPARLMLAFQAYTLMVIVRTVMMYLLPLDPPEGAIVLQDPLVQFVGGGNPLKKDLFFSGHTSTMFLLFLVSHKKVLRSIFIAFTLLVGTCVLWQHTHYSIDVAVAPFIAYASYRAALAWQHS